MSINATAAVQPNAAVHAARRPAPDYFNNPTTAAAKPSLPPSTATDAAQVAGGASPFQKLASDLQAALLSMQSGRTEDSGANAAASPAPGSIASGLQNFGKTLTADVMHAFQAYGVSSAKASAPAASSSSLRIAV